MKWCRIQKQQQAQLLAARLGSMDAPLADSMATGMTNGHHLATSAAPVSERLGSGGSGGTPPKHVTPLQTLAASQSLSLSNGLAQVASLLHLCTSIEFRKPEMVKWRVYRYLLQ